MQQTSQAPTHIVYSLKKKKKSYPSVLRGQFYLNSKALEIIFTFIF